MQVSGVGFGKFAWCSHKPEPGSRLSEENATKCAIAMAEHVGASFWELWTKKTTSTSLAHTQTVAAGVRKDMGIQSPKIVDRTGWERLGYGPDTWPRQDRNILDSAIEKLRPQQVKAKMPMEREEGSSDFE